MKQNSKKNYVITSLALYFTYFTHGIGASILGQYEPQFAKVWGATVGSDGTVDVSMVVSVIAALGLGRLISLPFSGSISDKFGRKLGGMIGGVMAAGSGHLGNRLGFCLGAWCGIRTEPAAV